MPLFVPRVADGRAVVNGSTHYTIPGLDPTGVAIKAMTASRIYYGPMFVTTPITIDQLACEVTTASGGGTVIRMAIYNADINWQPTTRVVDAGTVAADSQGVKTATVDVALAPGRYLFAIISDSTPSVRYFQGGTQFFGMVAGLSGSPFVFQGFVAGSGSTLPDPGTAWTSASGGTTPNQNMVVCRVSMP